MRTITNLKFKKDDDKSEEIIIDDKKTPATTLTLLHFMLMYPTLGQQTPVDVYTNPEQILIAGSTIRKCKSALKAANGVPEAVETFQLEDDEFEQAKKIISQFHLFKVSARYAEFVAQFFKPEVTEEANANS